MLSVNLPLILHQSFCCSGPLVRFVIANKLAPSQRNNTVIRKDYIAEAFVVALRTRPKLLAPGVNMSSLSAFKYLLLRVFIVAFAVSPILRANAADIRQEDLDESLITAASRGDMRSFNTAVSLGANLNAVDRQGTNAVLAATQGNRTQLLRTLLGKGINPNALGGSGFTPLTYAAMEGALQNVKLLLKAGANPNQRSALGETPLHLAAQFGHADVVAILASSGARIDALNDAGETPLITAIHADRDSAFEALLELGAEKDVSDRKNQSALYLAILEDHEKLARLLVERGARFERIPGLYTPLQMARFMGHASVIEALEKRGASE